MSSGNKYHRTIYGLDKYNCVDYDTVVIDVYSVLTAFNVVNPGIQHAVKKLLCAGIRGKGTIAQDLREARDALDRAIEDTERESLQKKKPEDWIPPVEQCYTSDGRDVRLHPQPG